MRPSIKTALLFVAIWFIVKMCFFWFQLFQDEAGVKILVMWNILCLLLAISIGTLIEKRREDRSQSSALGDIKSSMGGGMIYTVLVSVLLYVYYAKIDPAYNERQIAGAEAAILRDLNKPEMLKKYQQQPDYQSMTKEEIFREVRKGPRSFFNAGSTMSLSLLGMLLLTTINSIIVTVVYRRVLFRQRTL